MLRARGIYGLKKEFRALLRAWGPESLGQFRGIYLEFRGNVVQKKSSGLYLEFGALTKLETLNP